MILALYAFIAWAALIVFTWMPKRLGKLDNILIFVSVSMVILDLFSRVTTNLGLIFYDEKPDKFYSMCIYRSIIFPLCLLIFANLLASAPKKAAKAAAASGILLFILLMEYLSLQTGIIKATGWNIYYSMIVLAGLMVLSAVLQKVLSRA